MSLPAEIAADLAELELELPLVFYTLDSDGIVAAEYPCLPGSARSRKTIMDEGWLPGADLVLYVRAELFANIASRPQLKTKISYLDRTYCIEGSDTPPGEPFLKLVCALDV